MQKLEDVLETFRNDKNWNTEYQNGTHELPLAFPFRVNGNGFVPLMRRQACS